MTCFHVLEMCMPYSTHFKLVLCSNQNSFADTNPGHQLSNPNTYPSSHNISNYKLRDKRNKHNRYNIAHRTKDKKISNIDKSLTRKQEEYFTSSQIKVSNQKNLTSRNNQTLLENNRFSSSTLSHPSESDFMRRFPRQVSSQNVFRNNRNKTHGFFQSSGIEFLNPIDGDSGIFLPEVDYSDSSFYPDSRFEFVTEMSDKEFESLGFPVSPKPTDSYRLSGIDHNYEPFETDTGGFSGIKIISRELYFCCIEKKKQQNYYR